jgi:hypothetical protein
MTVHFSEGHFEIIVINKIRSCYYLTLSIIKLQDFIFVLPEQLSLNPKTELIEYR